MVSSDSVFTGVAAGKSSTGAMPPVRDDVDGDASRRPRCSGVWGVTATTGWASSGVDGTGIDIGGTTVLAAAALANMVEIPEAAEG